MLLQICSTLASSVWWEYWESNEACTNGEDIYHREWAVGGTCLKSEDLKEFDPLKLMTNGSDITLNCIDDDSNNRVAIDDDILINIFVSHDGSCSGLPISTVHYNTSERCGTKQLSPIALHCTKCEWVFFEASAAPYFLQAFGVLAFLFFCVIFNICCQRRIDRWSKVLPPKLLPCCFGASQPTSDFLLVELMPNFEDSSSPQTVQSFMLPRSITDTDTLLADPANKKCGILNLSMRQNQIHTPTTVQTDVCFGPRLTEGSVKDKRRRESPFKPPKGMNRTRTIPELRRPRHLFSVKNSDKSQHPDLPEDFLELLNSPDTPDKGLPQAGSTFGSTMRIKNRRKKSLSPIDDNEVAGLREFARRHSSISVVSLRDLRSSESPQSKKDNRRGREAMLSSPKSLPSDSSELVEFCTSAVPTSTKKKKNRRQKSISPVDDHMGTFPMSGSRRTLTRSASDMVELKEMRNSEPSPSHRRDRRRSGKDALASPKSQRSNSSEVVEMYQFHTSVEPLNSNQEDFNKFSVQSQPPSEQSTEVIEIYQQHNASPLSGCSTCGCELDPHDCNEWISMGATGDLGSYGVVRASDYEDSNQQTIKVTFLKPDTWLPTDSLEGNGIWGKLSERFGSIVLDQTTTEYQMELNANVTVQLPKQDLKWLSSNGCKYVRLRDDAKAVVPPDEWHNWYGDFLLCIGQVSKTTRVESNDSCYICVTFYNSAAITLPQEAFEPATEEEHTSECLIIPQLLEKRIMMAVFVASTPPLLSAKALFLVSVFIHAIIITSQDGHQGRAANHSLWEAYEEVYFKLFNSGYPTLMADCTTLGLYFVVNFKPTFKGFIRGVGVPSFIVLVITSVLSLPGILTHALPMAFFYGWIWFPLIAGVYFLSKAVISIRPSPPVMNPEEAFSLSKIWKNHRSYVVKACIYFLVFRFCIEIVGVVFLQTNFNYGVLIYDGGAYLKVIQTEFENREFLCVWEKGVQAASFLI